jgi:hypothetical protein
MRCARRPLSEVSRRWRHEVCDWWRSGHRALHSRALIEQQKGMREARFAGVAEGGDGSPSSAVSMALRAQRQTRKGGLRDAPTCAAVRARGRLREPPRRGERGSGSAGSTIPDAAAQHDRYLGVNSLRDAVPANPRLSGANEWHWYRSALRVLRIPDRYQMMWDHSFPPITTAVVTPIRR